MLSKHECMHVLVIDSGESHELLACRGGDPIDDGGCRRASKPPDTPRVNRNNTTSICIIRTYIRVHTCIRIQNDIVSSRENKIYFDARSERDESYDHVESSLSISKIGKNTNVTNDQIDRSPPIRIHLLQCIRICIVYILVYYVEIYYILHMLCSTLPCVVPLCLIVTSNPRILSCCHVMTHRILWSIRIRLLHHVGIPMHN